MGGGLTKPHGELHKHTLPGETEKYGSKAMYWDNRYLAEAPFQFDWLQRYGHYTEGLELRKLILETVPKKSYVLNLGAGTSRMSEEMNMDGYLTVLNVDISGAAMHIMTDHYRKRFGRWAYTVEPTCPRLYARRTTEHGNATDTELFATLTRLGIPTMMDWLLSLQIEVLGPCMRALQIASPRDVLVLEADQLNDLLAKIDDFMEDLEQKEHDLRHGIVREPLSPGGLLPKNLPKTLKQEREDLARHQATPGDDASTASSAPMPSMAGADKFGKTPSMKLQEATARLRSSLGLDVERGGGGRVLRAGDTFVVVERRFEGGQEHLLLVSGGWVVGRHPATQDVLCKVKKQIPGYYPPPSIILNPDSKGSDDAFLPSIDYKQMNALALDGVVEDTFDCVIAKGTVDAMMVAGKEGRENCFLMFAEVYRVLKPTGKFIVISHAGEHPDLQSRGELLKEEQGTFKWHVTTHKLPKPNTPGQFHGAFVCVPMPVDASVVWDQDEAMGVVVS